MKCITKKCNIYNNQNLNNLLIVPFESPTLEVRKLFSYFLHIAPNIESAHSKIIPSEKHDEIFERMMNNRHFKYKRFCSANAVIEQEFCECNLNDVNICLKCKRFVCKRRKQTKAKKQETDLNCFLRHIRNSIAHGRVYYCHAGNRIHIVFEDENSTGKLSARIVCIKADLEHLKQVLTDTKYR